MCGIAGIMRSDGGRSSLDEVRAMCGASSIAGRTTRASTSTPASALGMRRLSIIDLATGHQPIGNEDGTVWVVFNGEIYNYRELRRELEGARPRLPRRPATPRRSSTSTRSSGARCVDELRGMFAFALWDARRRQLLLARDRLGHQAAVLRASAADGWLFASELKAILQLPDVERAARLGGGRPSA